MKSLTQNYLDNVLVVHMHNCWEHEGKGFPRASLSNTNHVPTRKSNGPALTLDAGRLDKVFLLRQSLVNILRETCLLEGSHGTGDVLALHTHIVFLPELAHVLVTPRSDIFVLLQII
jgi:hypothetical protein